MRFFLITIFLLFNCTKPVNINIPKAVVKPVVSCIFNPDSLFKVNISTTQHILENRDTKITDAVVKLYENNILKDTLIYNSDSFISKLKPKATNSYSIYIDVPNYTNITSTDTLFPKPIVKPLFFLDSISKDVDGDVIGQAKIVLTDTSSKKNYYEIGLRAELINPKEWENPIVEVFFTPNNDPIIMNENMQAGHGSSIILSDELFNNKIQKLDINYGVLFPIDGNFIATRNYYLILTIRSISENYYNYKKTLVKHYNNQEQDIWQGLGKPIPMFTNIENGYGIFVGYNQVIDTVYKK